MVELRRGNLYLAAAILLTALNLIMIAVLGILIQQVTDIRDDARTAQAVSRTAVLNSRAGCERGNGLRWAVRFLLTTQEEIADVVGAASVTPEIRGYFRGIKRQYKPFLRLAGVKERDCAADYPLP